MIEERTRWHRVEDGRLHGLGEGGLQRVVVNKRPICFVRLNDKLYAMDDVCPHQGKQLSGGRCEEGYVVCPWHQMRFDPVTGRNRFGMTSNVPVYPVEEEGGAVRIGLPAIGFSLFGWKLW